MMRKTIVFTVFFLIYCLTAQAQLSPENFLLTKGKAGPLGVAMDTNMIKQAFPNAGIAKRVEMKEGSPYHIYAVSISEPGRKDTESLIIDVDGKPPKETVYSITVLDPRFKTSKGIGVGSMLQDLKKAYATSGLLISDNGRPIIIVEELGMTFELDPKNFIPKNGGRTANSIPQNATIQAIYIWSD